MKYLANFDGDVINGRRYAQGEEVEGLDKDVGTRTYLIGIGRVTEVGDDDPKVPAIGGTGTIIPAPEPKAPADMTREELIAAFGREAMAAASDDDLREALTRAREKAAEEAAPPPPPPAPPSPPPPPPPPPSTERPEVKASMKVADLETIAAKEGVDLSSASNNEDRVALIEAARKAS